MMFCTVATHEVNHWSAEERLEVLGLERRVPALHFCSVVKGHAARSFDGASRATEEIRLALMNRYNASVQEGLLGALEPGALTSVLKVRRRRHSRSSPLLRRADRRGRAPRSAVKSLAQAGDPALRGRRAPASPAGCQLRALTMTGHAQHIRATFSVGGASK